MEEKVSFINNPYVCFFNLSLTAEHIKVDYKVDFGNCWRGLG